MEDYSPTCPACQQMYAGRNPPGNPPCAMCMVALSEENADAANVYMLTRGQMISIGEGRVIDISIPAIKIVMDLLGIKNQKDCLIRVMKTFHYFKEKTRGGV